MRNIVNQFSEDILEDLERMIEDDLDRTVQGRSRWMESLVDVTKNYLGMNDDDRPIPWDGASDAFIPMTMISIETAHPRILGGIMGLDQTVTAVPTGGDSVRSAEAVSNFMNWALHSHAQLNAYHKLDKILHLSELCGRSYSDLRWKKNSKVVTREYTLPRYQEGAGTLMQVIKQVGLQGFRKQMVEVPYGQHLNQILGTRLIRIKGMTNYSDSVEIAFDYHHNGFILEGSAIVPTPIPGTTFIKMYVSAEELFKDSPELSLVYPVNIYHPLDEDDLKDCAFVAQRYWVDIEDLYAMRQEGTMSIPDDLWREIVGEDAGSDYDYNLNMARRDSRPESDTATVEDELRDFYARIYGDPETTDSRQGIEVVEYHRCMRLGGEPEDYIIRYLPGYHHIGQIVSLGVESPTGRRPYDRWEFMHATDGSSRSLGIGHIIMDLQGILNDVFNKQMDRDDLLTTPFGFYKPVNFSKASNIQIRPGMLLPTNDPNAINFPNWARPNGADMPYIQTIMGMVERLTSATNYFQGSAPDRPNAPRTYGATAAIIQEGNINFDLHIRRYQSTMYSMCLDIQGLYRHFMPTEMEFLAPGADELMSVGRQDLDKEYGYVFKGNSTNTNPAVRQQMASMTYQALIMNPLIQTSVPAMWNLTRRFAIAHGYLEFDQDVPKPAPEMSHAPMSQMEELESMRHGQNMAVLPTDNHEEHIKVIEEFLGSDLGVTLGPEFMSMVITHLTQHQQAAAMMQRAQMTGPGGGQQPGVGMNPGMLTPTGPETGSPGGMSENQ